MRACITGGFLYVCFRGLVRKHEKASQLEDQGTGTYGSFLRTMNPLHFLPLLGTQVGTLYAI